MSRPGRWWPGFAVTGALLVSGCGSTDMGVRGGDAGPANVSATTVAPTLTVPRSTVRPATTVWRTLPPTTVTTLPEATTTTSATTIARTTTTEELSEADAVVKRKMDAAAGAFDENWQVEIEDNLGEGYLSNDVFRQCAEPGSYDILDADDATLAASLMTASRASAAGVEDPTLRVEARVFEDAATADAVLATFAHILGTPVGRDCLKWVLTTELGRIDPDGLRSVEVSDTLVSTAQVGVRIVVTAVLGDLQDSIDSDIVMAALGDGVLLVGSFDYLAGNYLDVMASVVFRLVTEA